MKMFSNLNPFNKIFHKCFSIFKLFYNMTAFYNFVYKILCKPKLLLWTFMNLIWMFCTHIWFQLLMIVWDSKCFGSLSIVILILIVIYDISVWTSTGFLFWVCTRYSDSVSGRVIGTIGDTMWHELTFCFLWMWYMICFHK